MDGEISQNFGSFQPQSVVQPQAQPQNQRRGLSSIGDLFSKTWRAYTSILGTLVGIMAIGFGFYFLAMIIAISMGMGTSLGFRSLIHPQMLMLSRIGNWLLALLLVLMIFSAGAIIYSWLTMSVLYAIKERKQKLSIGKALRKGWSRWISYLWISFLVGLCVVGGATLLIIPGIIFFVWFAFAQYALADQDLKGTKALSQSRELVRGYWWPVFGRILLITLIVAIIAAILDLIPFIGDFIIQLLVYPFMFVFYFILYEDLKRIKTSQLSKPEVVQ